MTALDIALRAAGAGMLLLVACSLLASAPKADVSRWFALFALGVCGFLGVNTPFDAAELRGPAWHVASFLSRMATPALWLFCLTLFDSRPAPRTAAAIASLWFALVVVDKGYLTAPPRGFDASALLIVLGAALVLHAAWRVVRDLRGDLVEPRRRARPSVAIALLVLLASDLGVDVLMGYAWRPPAFLLAQNALILGLALGSGLWLLRADVRAAVDHPAAPRPTGHASAPPALPDPDAPILARIARLMAEDRAYLDPELDIATFAVRAGVAEPALRRVINHRLGHAHFRTFLNAHRIEEAKRRLRDPARAGDKMVAIAFDSGFASLASFNRVFRQAVGRTPSEYRAGADGARPAVDRVAGGA